MLDILTCRMFHKLKPATISYSAKPVQATFRWDWFQNGVNSWSPRKRTNLIDLTDLLVVHGFNMIQSCHNSIMIQSVFCCLFSISIQNGSPVEHWSTSFVYRKEKRGLKMQLSFSHKGKAEPTLSAVLISFVSSVPTLASLKISWTAIVCSQQSQLFELLWFA